MILLMTTAPPEKGPWIHGRHFIPLGLAYVAAALEREGFQVKILDNYLLEMTIDEVKTELRRLHPDLVGITCSSATYGRCIETAKAVKEVLPSCKVVVGGWHPTYKPESMLQHPEIDYAVIGEGERAMVELATNLLGTRVKSRINKIAGIAFLKNGQTIKNTQDFISNLDELPFPARHLLPIDLYDRTIEYLGVKPVDNMSIVRGCPFNCAFCETKKLWGEKCRSFSPNRVIEEIRQLITEYGTKGIYFVNDNFTIKQKNTLELCTLMEKNHLDISWVCDTRADLINKDLLIAMKSAGCKTICFGGESGSPRILKKINNGITLEKMKNALRLCREVGIQTACSFLLGIPGETVEDMKATFRFARRLDPDWCRFNIFVAVPGSSLYEEVMREQLYDRIEDFVAYVRTKEFNYETLLEIQRKFHGQFNRTPKRILRKISREGIFSFLRRTPQYIWRQINE